MTEKETRDLASTNAVAGLCPITESSLGDGIFNGTDFHDARGQFGIGSDSNIHIALWEELATLEYSQRLRDRSRAAMATPDRSTGRNLFEAATQAGAQAGGRQSGSISEGQFADLIAFQPTMNFCAIARVTSFWIVSYFLDGGVLVSAMCGAPDVIWCKMGYMLSTNASLNNLSKYLSNSDKRYEDNQPLVMEVCAR